MAAITPGPGVATDPPLVTPTNGSNSAVPAVTVARSRRCWSRPGHPAASASMLLPQVEAVDRYFL
jgi:hypothetical protein